MDRYSIGKTLVGASFNENQSSSRAFVSDEFGFASKEILSRESFSFVGNLLMESEQPAT